MTDVKSEHEHDVTPYQLLGLFSMEFVFSSYNAVKFDMQLVANVSVFCTICYAWQ